MAGRGFRQAGFPNRPMDGPLHHGLVQVMPAALAARRVEIRPRRGEHPLPGPLAAGVRILPRQRMRQLHPAGTRVQVARVLRPDSLEVTLQRGPHQTGKERHAIAIPLPAPHDDLVGPKVQVLDAQARTFEQPQPGPVEHDAHQPGVPCSASSTPRTSSRDRTTGSRAGRAARTSSSNHGSWTPSTCP